MIRDAWHWIIYNDGAGNTHATGCPTVEQATRLAAELQERLNCTIVAMAVETAGWKDAVEQEVVSSHVV